MTVAVILLYVVVALMAISIGMAAAKKRWYLVYTADQQKLILSRSLFEWEVAGTLIFRDEEKRRVMISKHWVLKITELRKDDLVAEKAKLEAENGIAQ